MSSIRSIPTAVRQALAVADRHNVTFPKQLRATLDTQMRLVEKAQQFAVSGTSVADAVLDALASDRDPLNDPEVHAAVVRYHVGSLRSTDVLVDSSRVKLYETVHAHVDDIVAAYQPAYNKAGADLAEAHATITSAGYPDLDDSGLIKAALPVATANVNARTALQILTAIDNAIAPLLSVTSTDDGTPVGRIVRTIDTGNAPAHEIRLLSHSNPWHAITAGYTVSLATPTEALERYARAYEAQGAADRDYDEQVRRAQAARHQFA